MKSNILRQIGVSVVLISFISSCISSQSFIPVKGSGMATDKTFNVTDFNGIEVSGGFDVILSQGTNESVTLSAQENLFEYIHVEVEQGILKIYTENNLMPTKPLKARVMFKNINNLQVSGGGDVKAETNISAETLEIGMTGGGDIDANIEATNLSCNISGGGDANLNGTSGRLDVNMNGGGNLTSTMNTGNLFCRLSGGGDLFLRSDKEANDIKFELSGGGDADVAVNTSSLTCNLSGGGNASLSGKATQLDLHLNGGGDVKASGMNVASVTFQVSGGSDLHLNVSDELRGNISGGGDIYYSGSPEIVSIDARGGSEVHKE